MNHHEPGISYPRGRDDWMRDHPLASRLLIMIVGFAVLVPIAVVIRSSQGNVVRSGGLPGASLGADPLIESTSTSTVAPSSEAAAVAVSTTAPATGAVTPATTAAPAPSTAAPTAPPATAAAREAAVTTAKKPATTAAAPATTVKKKTTTVATTTKATNPPTTKAAPSTTEKPPVTTPPPTSPPTSEATFVAPPENTHSREEVEGIIRSVFPAEEADEAVRIATRESNLVPTVRNWCCFGLFQIYFEMNKKTLAAIGVTEAAQLFDPWVNTQAAYVLFQRSGWAPWR